jgi:nucleoside-diphosphate-sugar epimerase
MRILVTGGTGTLGRAAVPKLAAAGHTVRVMTRHPRDSGETEMGRADLATGAGITEAVSESEVVVHLASAPYKGRYDPWRRAADRRSNR